MEHPQDATLIVVDVQLAFEHPRWGARNNPDAEDNVAVLLAHWRREGQRVIHIQHRNSNPSGLFHPDNPGFQPKPQAAPLASEPVITKTVNSAFIGTDLEQRLRADGVSSVVICGITTDHCVSTTTRMAGNLGFSAFVVSDATATFERVGPDGRTYAAQEMHDTALASLHQEFATVVTTADLVGASPRTGGGRSVA